MPTLPVRITVKGAPADVVSRTVVVCGYELQKVNRSACDGVLDAAGGTLVGQIESDPMSKFPAKVHVDLKVDFTTETGLTHIEKAVDVDVALGGVNYVYELKPPVKRKITVNFDFTKLNLNPGGSFQLSWEHKVDGAAVRSGQGDVVAATPAQQAIINLVLDPERSNTFELRMKSLTGKFPDSPSVDFDVIPFAGPVPLDKDRAVLMRALRDPNAKTIRFTTEIN